MCGVLCIPHIVFMSPNVIFYYPYDKQLRELTIDTQKAKIQFDIRRNHHFGHSGFDRDPCY